MTTTSFPLLEEAISMVSQGAGEGLVVVLHSAETAEAAKLLIPVAIPVVWTATTHEALGALNGQDAIYLPVRLDRLDLVSHAVVHAIIQGRLEPSCRLVCLSEGRSGLDLLQTIKPDVDLELANVAAWTVDRGIDPNALLAVLGVAVELGSDRTGRAAGALFTIGDAEAVLSCGEDYPFEPFEGRPSSLRQITHVATQIAIQKYARVDGVFVIGGDGVVKRFIKQINPRQRSPHLDKSLGSRHAAAAGITLDTLTISILVTESGGNVKLFKDGQMVLFYKPR